MLMDRCFSSSFARMSSTDGAVADVCAGHPRRRDVLGGLGAAALVGALPGAAWAAPAGIGEVVRWPEVTLLDGRRWGAAQASGKTVVVVFWSTTCPFCLRHNAHIEKLRRAAAGRPLEVVTVARDKDAAAVRNYLERHAYGFGVTLDQGPMSAALSARRVIPLTAVIEPSGRLRQLIPGEMFEDDVMELLPPA
jgi:thiol-disulfide isomerase/thioredoxin